MVLTKVKVSESVLVMDDEDYWFEIKCPFCGKTIKIDIEVSTKD